MQGTVTRALQSNSTSYTPSIQSTAIRARVDVKLSQFDASQLLLRGSIAFMMLTVILIPGAFRALAHAGVGWEAWSSARWLILSVMVFHLILCWLPLALRYFRPGECRDVRAFIIATVALFTQILIGVALQHYAIWRGA